MLFKYNLRNYNFRMLVFMMVLTGIGVLAINSASNQDPARVSRQILGIVVSLCVTLAISLIDYHKILRFATLIYSAGIISLIAVLLSGNSAKGATRWLVLPVIGQIQPSEFMKIALIIFFSWYFNKYQEEIDKPKVVGMALLFYLIPIGLIYLQPNLSTCLITTAIVAVLVFASGISYKWILGVLAVACPVAVLFIYLLQYEMIPFIKDYQAKRILAWVNPLKYSDSWYQTENSIIAIGSGQLNGKGLYNTTIASVKNGNFLSEEQTDFIFAIIGEELGFVGCMVVIGLFLVIIYECLIMASRARDLSGKLVCSGMAALLAFQTFSNIAVATGIFPNTGLTLPFISYGVSSLLSIFIGMGITLNIGLQRRISN